MTRSKRFLGVDVLTAARQRIAYVFDRFERIYLSGPSGKDSGVMMHLVCEEARRRGRRVGVLYVDLEAQYRNTIEWVAEMFALYSDCVDPYWLCLPVALRNAVSQFAPKWCAWDPTPGVEWVRQPPAIAITDPGRFPWYCLPEPGPRAGETAMEFEEIVPAFADWYAQGTPTACFVGIRSAESLNRWRTIAGRHARFRDPDTGVEPCWTTRKGAHVFNAYPIYDWRTEDVWRYYGRERKLYNRVYDLMHRAGLSIHEQRICQPYGDDQRKGLWLFHLLEPETWSAVVGRVAGANHGALYAQERGSVLGRFHVKKPDGLTWRQYTEMLLASMPPKTRGHFDHKFAYFKHWWTVRGHPPDGWADSHSSKVENGSAIDENGHKLRRPSWRRLAKAILKYDYWCKSLSFSPHKSDSYDKWVKIMERRRVQWGL